MRNKCDVNGICSLNNSSNVHAHYLLTKLTLRNFISLRAFTVYMKNSVQFEISLWSNWPKWHLHRSDFHSAWTHVNTNNEITITEVKFYREVKSQTGLSSLRVSCKRALKEALWLLW